VKKLNFCVVDEAVIMLAGRITAAVGPFDMVPVSKVNVNATAGRGNAIVDEFDTVPVSKVNVNATAGRGNAVVDEAVIMLAGRIPGGSDVFRIEIGGLLVATWALCNSLTSLALGGLVHMKVLNFLFASGFPGGMPKLGFVGIRIAIMITMMSKCIQFFG
jgi:hypothetical protein